MATRCDPDGPLSGPDDSLPGQVQWPLGKQSHSKAIEMHWVLSLAVKHNQPNIPEWHMTNYDV